MYYSISFSHSLKTPRDFKVIISALMKNIKVNITKLNVYKKALQEVCKNFVGAEEFVRDKTEEICCNKKLSVLEVIYFVYKRL